MTETPTAGPVVTLYRDLTAIVHLSSDLAEQAQNKANDHLMPGGLAMVALGPVAAPTEYAETLEAAEHQALAGRREFPEIEDDDTWEPPLQTLLFWSEAWREIHGYPLPKHPTEASEANFLRWAAEWAWDNERRWDDFAADVRRAKARLEELLLDGVRHTNGVPCLSCGKTLVRRSVARREHHACEGHDGVCYLPHDRCPHDRGGLRDEWNCPECRRRYGLDDYYRAVHYAHLAHADYLPLDEAAERTGVRAGTIKVWATRDKVRRRKMTGQTRMTYNIRDIERHAKGDDVAS